MIKLKTDPQLLEALKRSATQKLSVMEVHAQRVSFILGSVNGVTRDQVERALMKQACQLA